MRPIEFTCRGTLPLSPREICEEISRVERWSEFRGYGPIPGVAHAEYEIRTDAMVGSRIRVRNRDGSRHVEEIVAWRPDRAVTLHLKEFSPPLDRLASHFAEDWTFAARGGETAVSRRFVLHPRGRVRGLILRVISVFLKKAIERHLHEMRGAPL